MKLIFAEQAWEDYLYWQTQDRKNLKKINSLIKEIKRNPFEGTGCPEPLKHNVFNACRRGYSNKDAAREGGISVATVERFYHQMVLQKISHQLFDIYLLAY